jgi:hypothetical protein
MYRISVADYTYIGSTRDFKQRKQNHKSVCNNVNNKYHNLKIYQMIRENGGWNKCEMIPIEECECENKLQSYIREEELRKEYNAEMNAIKAYRTIEQKQEYQKEYHKEWYQENGEQKYTCECGSVICISDKSRHMKTKKHQNYIKSLVVATA